MSIQRILKQCLFAVAIIAGVGGQQCAMAALAPGGGAASSGDYAGSPPLAVQGADPFLMVDLSVELTQQAEAFTDGYQTYANGTVCPNRLNGQATPRGSMSFGVCYTPAEKYIGYFDSEKCYSYDVGDGGTWNQQAKGPYPSNGIVSSLNPPHFKPAGLAVNHTCVGKFSGNFLNWSTMTALDEFRSAMTGGARLIDTAGNAAKTMLIRTRRFDDWDYVYKAISLGGLTVSNTAPVVSKTFANDPLKVTPFTAANFAATTPASAAVTSACSCNVANSPSLCTRSGNPDRAPTACTCSQTLTTTYAPSNTMIVANHWGSLGVGASLHKTRFYTYDAGTTSGTTTTNYSRSGGYTCPSNVAGVAATSSSVGAWRPLSLGGVSEFNVIVKVCDSSAGAGGLESNCIKYTNGVDTWYKPEGLLQKNALKMRYALTSYTGRTGNGINGGVLRANAKYIGAQRPTPSGGIEDNPNKEIDSLGLFTFDPDKVAGKAGGVNGISPVNSGVANYINQFALFAGRYKSNDPDAELYYEGLRYLMHLPPTPSFRNPVTPLTAAEQDGYPIFGEGNAASPKWDDPIANSCQKNYALYVGDKNSWMQNYLPGGTSLDLSNDPVCGAECDDAVGKGINTTSLENDIGSRDGGNATTSYGPTHGDGLAALAWWAHTHDIRTDIDQIQKIKTYIVDTQEYGASTPVGTSNTLWRAAKWGGFEDTNNDVFGTAAVPSPDLLSEWNAKGASFNGTPLPDTYTLASQPANLVAGLTSAFNEVLSKTSSAAAAAVVANSTVGTAAIYQALYRPRTSNNNTAVTWTGLVRSFFIDDKGRIREDTDGDGKLTNADNVIVFRQDLVNQIAVADRYTVGGALLVSDVPVDSLVPIWNASDKLAALSNAQVTAQRAYASVASAGRYIFTWMDLNKNGVIDAGEIQDFVPTSFPALTAATNDAVVDPARLLGSSVSNPDPTKLINYIRGVDLAGYRNRTIDQGSGLQTLRLGDVVHSAPLVVSAPAQNYDTLNLDDAYAAFKLQYKNRRQVLYVGANDGMLHAFNGGFFDNATNGFYTASAAGVGAETKHPLGGELWAYVPYNLLPHLQWLTDSAYQHTYYVDGAPQSFDVNIFPVDADHPYGWGTILVVGFRLGGGDITVNAETDQVGVADPGNRTLRSAYVVFDITNPEVAPKLLAELSDPSLGFTVGKPTIAKKRAAIAGSFKTVLPGDSARNQWYLVMGSGPAGTDATSKQLALTNAVSNQQARMFVYDLNQMQWVDSNTGTPAVDGFLIPGQNNSFVGDLTLKDWNDDYIDDVVYFGTVGTAALPAQDPIGDLMRMQMPTGFSFGVPTFSTLLTGNTNTPTNGQPFSMAPLALKDVSGQPWVYAGSGRFYVSSDILSQKQMSYYGIKEPLTGATLNYGAVDKSALINTTGIQVFTDGTVKSSTGSTLVINAHTITTYSQLIAEIGSADGWYFNFTGLSERDVDITQQFFDSLLITGYRASNNSCSPLGASRRLAAGLLTGTATPSAALGFDPVTHLVTYSRDLGIGQFFSSGVIQVGLGKNTIYLDPTTGSTGEENVGSLYHKPTAVGRRMWWRELPLQ